MDTFKNFYIWQVFPSVNESLDKGEPKEAKTQTFIVDEQNNV